jgi:hypothetical protein
MPRISRKPTLPNFPSFYYAKCMYSPRNFIGCLSGRKEACSPAVALEKMSIPLSDIGVQISSCLQYYLMSLITLGEGRVEASIIREFSYHQNIHTPLCKVCSHPFLPPKLIALTCVRLPAVPLESLRKLGYFRGTHCRLGVSHCGP